MSKIHHKESSSKPKAHDIGRVSIFKTQEVPFKVSLHTVTGTENIPAAKTDRVMIIIQGFASTTDTKQVIRDGAVIELKAGETFSYQGQLKYYLIEN